MHTWQVHDAKARFSELLEVCLSEGPQMVTKRGVEAAVLVSAREWKRLQSAARPSLKQWLLADAARGGWLVEERGKSKSRSAPAL